MMRYNSKTRNRVDTWEDWVFEDDDRFWLAFSRVMLSIAAILASVAGFVYAVHELVVALGTWGTWTAGVGVVLLWVRWTLTGGKTR